MNLLKKALELLAKADTKLWKHTLLTDFKASQLSKKIFTAQVSVFDTELATRVDYGQCNLFAFVKADGTLYMKLCRCGQHRDHAMRDFVALS